MDGHAVEMTEPAPGEGHFLDGPLLQAPRGLSDAGPGAQSGEEDEESKRPLLGPARGAPGHAAHNSGDNGYGVFQAAGRGMAWFRGGRRGGAGMGAIEAAAAPPLPPPVARGADLHNARAAAAARRRAATGAGGDEDTNYLGFIGDMGTGIQRRMRRAGCAARRPHPARLRRGLLAVGVVAALAIAGISLGVHLAGPGTARSLAQEVVVSVHHVDIVRRPSRADAGAPTGAAAAWAASWAAAAAASSSSSSSSSSSGTGGGGSGGPDLDTYEITIAGALDWPEGHSSTTAELEGARLTLAVADFDDKRDRTALGVLDLSGLEARGGTSVGFDRTLTLTLARSFGDGVAAYLAQDLAWLSLAGTVDVRVNYLGSRLLQHTATGVEMNMTTVVTGGGGLAGSVATHFSAVDLWPENRDAAGNAVEDRRGRRNPENIGLELDLSLGYGGTVSFVDMGRVTAVLDFQHRSICVDAAANATLSLVGPNATQAARQRAGLPDTGTGPGGAGPVEGGTPERTNMAGDGGTGSGPLRLEGGLLLPVPNALWAAYFNGLLPVPLTLKGAYTDAPAYADAVRRMEVQVAAPSQPGGLVAEVEINTASITAWSGPAPAEATRRARRAQQSPTQRDDGDIDKDIGAGGGAGGSDAAKRAYAGRRLKRRGHPTTNAQRRALASSDPVSLAPLVELLLNMTLRLRQPLPGVPMELQRVSFDGVDLFHGNKAAAAAGGAPRVGSLDIIAAPVDGAAGGSSSGGSDPANMVYTLGAAAADLWQDTAGDEGAAFGGLLEHAMNDAGVNLTLAQPWPSAVRVAGTWGPMGRFSFEVPLVPADTVLRGASGFPATTSRDLKLVSLPDGSGGSGGGGGGDGGMLGVAFELDVHNPAGITFPLPADTTAQLLLPGSQQVLAHVCIASSAGDGECGAAGDIVPLHPGVSVLTMAGPVVMEHASILADCAINARPVQVRLGHACVPTPEHDCRTDTDTDTDTDSDSDTDAASAFAWPAHLRLRRRLDCAADGALVPTWLSEEVAGLQLSTALDGPENVADRVTFTGFADATFGVPTSSGSGSGSDSGSSGGSGDALMLEMGGRLMLGTTVVLPVPWQPQWLSLSSVVLHSAGLREVGRLDAQDMARLPVDFHGGLAGETHNNATVVVPAAPVAVLSGDAAQTVMSQLLHDTHTQWGLSGVVDIEVKLARGGGGGGSWGPVDTFEIHNVSFANMAADDVVGVGLASPAPGAVAASLRITGTTSDSVEAAFEWRVFNPGQVTLLLGALALGLQHAGADVGVVRFADVTLAAGTVSTAVGSVSLRFASAAAGSALLSPLVSQHEVPVTLSGSAVGAGAAHPLVARAVQAIELPVSLTGPRTGLVQNMTIAMAALLAGETTTTVDLVLRDTLGAGITIANLSVDLMACSHFTDGACAAYAHHLGSYALEGPVSMRDGESVVVRRVTLHLPKMDAARALLLPDLLSALGFDALRANGTGVAIIGGEGSSSGARGGFAFPLVYVQAGVDVFPDEAANETEVHVLGAHGQVVGLSTAPTGDTPTAARAVGTAAGEGAGAGAGSDWVAGAMAIAMGETLDATMDLPMVSVTGDLEVLGANLTASWLTTGGVVGTLQSTGVRIRSAGAGTQGNNATLRSLNITIPVEPVGIVSAGNAQALVTALLRHHHAMCGISASIDLEVVSEDGPLYLPGQRFKWLVPVRGLGLGASGAPPSPCVGRITAGSPTELHWNLSVSLTNPSNASIDLGRLVLDVAVAGGTKVGRVVVPAGLLPAGANASLPCTAVLDFGGSASLAGAFLSQFLSEARAPLQLQAPAAATAAAAAAASAASSGHGTEQAGAATPLSANPLVSSALQGLAWPLDMTAASPTGLFANGTLDVARVLRNDSTTNITLWFADATGGAGVSIKAADVDIVLCADAACEPSGLGHTLGSYRREAGAAPIVVPPGRAAMVDTDSVRLPASSEARLALLLTLLRANATYEYVQFSGTVTIAIGGFEVTHAYTQRGVRLVASDNGFDAPVAATDFSGVTVDAARGAVGGRLTIALDIASFPVEVTAAQRVSASVQVEGGAAGRIEVANAAVTPLPGHGQTTSMAAANAVAGGGGGGSGGSGLTYVAVDLPMTVLRDVDTARLGQFLAIGLGFPRFYFVLQGSLSLTLRVAGHANATLEIRDQQWWHAVNLRGLSSLQAEPVVATTTITHTSSSGLGMDLAFAVRNPSPQVHWLLPAMSLGVRDAMGTPIGTMTTQPMTLAPSAVTAVAASADLTFGAEAIDAGSPTGGGAFLAAFVSGMGANVSLVGPPTTAAAAPAAAAAAADGNGDGTGSDAPPSAMAIAVSQLRVSALVAGRGPLFINATAHTSDVIKGTKAGVGLTFALADPFGLGVTVHASTGVVLACNTTAHKVGCGGDAAAAQPCSQWLTLGSYELASEVVVAPSGQATVGGGHVPNGAALAATLMRSTAAGGSQAGMQVGAIDVTLGDALRVRVPFAQTGLGVRAQSPVLSETGAGDTVTLPQLKAYWATLTPGSAAATSSSATAAAAEVEATAKPATTAARGPSGGVGLLPGTYTGHIGWTVDILTGSFVDITKYPVILDYTYSDPSRQVGGRLLADQIEYELLFDPHTMALLPEAVTMTAQAYRTLSIYQREALGIVKAQADGTARTRVGSVGSGDIGLTGLGAHFAADNIASVAQMHLRAMRATLNASVNGGPTMHPFFASHLMTLPEAYDYEAYEAVLDIFGAFVANYTEEGGWLEMLDEINFSLLTAACMRGRNNMCTCPNGPADKFTCHRPADQVYSIAGLAAAVSVSLQSYFGLDSHGVPLSAQVEYSGPTDVDKEGDTPPGIAEVPFYVDNRPKQAPACGGGNESLCHAGRIGEWQDTLAMAPGVISFGLMPLYQLVPHLFTSTPIPNLRVKMANMKQAHDRYVSEKLNDPQAWTAKRVLDCPRDGCAHGDCSDSLLEEACHGAGAEMYGKKMDMCAPDRGTTGRAPCTPVLCNNCKGSHTCGPNPSSSLGGACQCTGGWSGDTCDIPP